ncbi:unnamed protein product [Clonostachys rosea]|uniref:Cx9C motif-containing protein 4, mitochondrial n=1 Tax=Bionectria ochroleuca TaxID=29856 RepID=A0ABY6UY23_BIOOC|nr:unnamed protein product [Clonostachys rosea]
MWKQVPHAILELVTACLTKNGYKEERCQSVIKALYQCCEVFYDRYGDDATSPSCPKPKLLRLKLEQLKDQ